MPVERVRTPHEPGNPGLQPVEGEVLDDLVQGAASLRQAARFGDQVLATESLRDFVGGQTPQPAERSVPKATSRRRKGRISLQPTVSDYRSGLLGSTTPGSLVQHPPKPVFNPRCSCSDLNDFIKSFNRYGAQCQSLGINPAPLLTILSDEAISVLLSELKFFSLDLGLTHRWASVEAETLQVTDIEELADMKDALDHGDVVDPHKLAGDISACFKKRLGDTNGLFSDKLIGLIRDLDRLGIAFGHSSFFSMSEVIAEDTKLQELILKKSIGALNPTITRLVEPVFHTYSAKERSLVNLLQLIRKNTRGKDEWTRAERNGRQESQTKPAQQQQKPSTNKGSGNRPSSETKKGQSSSSGPDKKNKAQKASTSSSSSSDSSRGPRPWFVDDNATCDNCGGTHHFFTPDGERNCPKFMNPRKYRTELAKWEEENKKGKGATPPPKKGGGVKDEKKVRRVKADNQAPVFVYSPCLDHLGLTLETRPCLPLNNVSFDSGAEVSILPFRTVERMRKEFGNFELPPPDKRKCSRIDVGTGKQYKVVGEIKLSLLIKTGISNGVMYELVFIVPEQDYLGTDCALIGADFLSGLDIDVSAIVAEKLAERASSEIEEFQQADVLETAYKVARVLSTPVEPDNVDPAAVMKSLTTPINVELDEEDDFTTGTEITYTSEEEARGEKLREVLMERIAIARENGFPEELMPLLEETILTRTKAFALCFYHDMPFVDCRPWNELAVAKNTEDVVKEVPPVRHYSQLKKKFLDHAFDPLLESNRLERWNGFGPDAEPEHFLGFAAVHCVPKATAQMFRITIDMRACNARMVAIPLCIEEPRAVVDRVLSSRFTSYFSFDAFKGFWLIRTGPRTKNSVVITSPSGLFVSNAVIQGGKNSLAAFWFATQQVFEGLLDDWLHLYVDDGLAGAHSIHEHLERLATLLDRCIEKNMALNPSKFVPFTRAPAFLGFQINSDHTVSPDEGKITFLLELPVPTTLALLNTFLCLLNYLRASLPNIAMTMDPLMALQNELLAGSSSRKKAAMTRIDLPPHWTSEHEEAYDGCKATLANAVRLSAPGNGDQLLLFCDASDHGYGCMLAFCDPMELQRDWDDRTIKPMAFNGGVFSSRVRNYDTQRREAYAVISAIDHFQRQLFACGSVILFTDCLNLVAAFQRLRAPTTSKVASGVLHRVAIKLSQYPITVMHVPGDKNLAADYISRVFTPSGGDSAKIRKVTAVPNPDSDSDKVAFNVSGTTYYYGQRHAPAEITPEFIIPHRTRRQQRALVIPTENPSSNSSPGEGEVTSVMENSDDDNDVFDGEASSAEDENSAAASTLPATGVVVGNMDNDVDAPYDRLEELDLVDTYNETRASALVHKDFIFPTISEIRESQQRAILERDEVCDFDTPAWDGVPDILRVLDKIEVDDDGQPVRINNKQVVFKNDAVFLRSKGQRERLYIPVRDIALHCRILTVAHAGLSAHLRIDETADTVREVFDLKGTSDWAKYFCDGCLNCRSTRTGIVVPRPLAATLRPSAPMEAITFDIASIFDKGSLERKSRKVGDAAPYALVIKDMFTSYCRIVPLQRATAYECMLAVADWIGSFGFPSVFCSDTGTHFCNSLFALLARNFKIKHVFSPPYHARANGQAEASIKQFKKKLAVLLSEFRTGVELWERYIPLVTYHINNAPVRTRGGQSPLRLLAGIERKSPFHNFHFVIPEEGELAKFPSMSDSVKARLDELAEVIEGYRSVASEAMDSSREFAREAFNSRIRSPARCISVGDFVLSRELTRRPISKLSFTWIGPHRVVEADPNSPSVFVIEDLLTKRLLRRHSTFLLHYAENLRSVTQSMLRQAFHDRFSPVITELGGIRKGPDGYVLEMVADGFYPGDPNNHWVDIATVYSSLPDAVQKYTRQMYAREATRQDAQRVAGILGFSLVDN